MASKRINGSDSAASAGSAPARVKNTAARKHRSATAASPVTATASTLPAESPVTRPAFEDIAQLAYSYWEARGYHGGCPEEDWLRAESELTSVPMAANVTA